MCERPQRTLALLTNEQILCSVLLVRAVFAPTDSNSRLGCARRQTSRAMQFCGRRLRRVRARAHLLCVRGVHVRGGAAVCELSNN